MRLARKTVMAGLVKEKRKFLIAALGVSLFLGVSMDAGAQKKTSKKKPVKQDDSANSSEPDKVLYERAQADLKHSRYTEGRLALQTLINTYPDSEYLAKAKLAIADSYYKEGGTSNLTQAISEYKDFETFFPFLDEAAYAQMQVGMAHYKMMEKADRDTSQTQLAEDELQAMLLKYPQSPLAPQAEQRLREVQEVLADGEFKIAKFYYTKQDPRAAGARLAELTDRYPLYSQSDEANWMLADIFMKTKQTSKDEDVRNFWAERAGNCYAHIARDYPLSKRAPEAKARLKSMGMQVPAPDPNALARMQKEQNYAKEHHSAFSAFLNSPLGMLKSGPDVSTAAHSGQPNLNPPTDTFAATEVLKPGSNGPGMSVSGGTVVAGSGAGNDTTSTQAGVTSSGSSTGASTTGRNVGVQIITPPADAVAPTAGDPSATAAPATSPAATGTSSPPPPAQTETTDPTPKPTPEAPTPATTPTDRPGLQSTPKVTDPKDESTSKKKKGLRKLVPW